MFLDLKPQELMDSMQCFCIPGRDSYSSSVRGLLKSVSDCLLELFHCGNARRHLIVYGHRCLKVTLGKCMSNLCEMPANLYTAGVVFQLIDCDFNCAAIGK